MLFCGLKGAFAELESQLRLYPTGFGQEDPRSFRSGDGKLPPTYTLSVERRSFQADHSRKFAMQLHWIHILNVEDLQSSTELHLKSGSEFPAGCCLRKPSVPFNRNFKFW